MPPRIPAESRQPRLPKSSPKPETIHGEVLETGELRSINAQELSELSEKAPKVALSPETQEALKFNEVAKRLRKNWPLTRDNALTFEDALRILRGEAPGAQQSPSGVLPPAPAIEGPAQPQGATMAENEQHQFVRRYALQLGYRLAQKTITNRGTRFFPLLFVAALAQAPESTIREWIKREIKFGGRLIQTYTSPSDGLYVSEDSVNRIGQRFVKWSSKKKKPVGPAGPVTIGETDNQSGHIGLPEMARILGVDHHTAWRWITKGTSPLGRPLDVIKDPAANEFYVSEKDVADLKNTIPRSGLRRGRRPQSQLARS